MAFGRDGGSHLGGDSSVYASRQDSNNSSSNTPHWMKQLEEKYQRLHAKIINQAAKFSNARFNAINNNINQHRSLSHRNSSVSKSSTISSGSDGVNATLHNRGSSLSSSAAFSGKYPQADNIETDKDFRRGIKTGSKRRSRDKQMMWEDSGLENKLVANLPVSRDALKRSIVNRNVGGSADSGERDDHLISSSSPTPPGLNEANTPPAPLRTACDAGRVTQAETCDPVRVTLAKTSAAIALLNSSSVNDSAQQSRRGGKRCSAGSRLKSPRQARVRQQSLEPQQTFEDDDGRLSESVYYIPAGTSTSGGFNNSNNTVYCFEKEVSGGISTQQTPRASKPTTRASSSLALTRLSSANFASVSRPQSPLREEVEVQNSYEGDTEKLKANDKFFTKRRDSFVPNSHQQINDNGHVNGWRFRETQGYIEDHDQDSQDGGSDYSSCEKDTYYSGDYEEDVFLEEDSSVAEKCSNQQVGMEMVKAKSRRHASRPIRPSVSRLGQKAHKSCPTYFWKSANPHATADGEDEREHGRLQRRDDKTDKGQASIKKNKKSNLRKKDRRGAKSHEVRKNNVHADITDSKNNNDNTLIDDNRKEDGDIDENDNDEFYDDSHDHTNNNSQQQHAKHRRDSKGTISPVLGTVLPLTARAVEEGRMRVFARMSLEARHAVDETLKEMEREEEKWSKERTFGKQVDVDSVQPTGERESTMDVSVMNHASGTCPPSRAIDRDKSEAGHDQDRTMVDGGGAGGYSQESIASDNLQDDFYASKKFHNSNVNYLQTKTHPDFTHSPSSSIGAFKRGNITGQRASSRRLPHLSDLAAPPQTSSLPNPHSRLPGIGSKPLLPLSYRETTFEITPPDFDIRFHHIISCQIEDRETPPPDIRQQSIDKCQQWLTKHNPK